MSADKKDFFMEAACELSETLMGIDVAAIEGLADDILAAKRVFIAGAGRTLLMMRALAMSLMQIGLSSHAVGDTTTPSLTDSDLLIAASYSGKTESTLLFVKKAASLGAKIVLFTAHTKSPMAEYADRVILISSASDDTSKKISRQFEGDGFEHALVPLGDVIIHLLCERTGASRELMMRNHANLE
jgi:6-phospho-3-hexuloisomerase